MAFLFARSKQKAPLELVRSTKELLQKLATLDKLPSTVSSSAAISPKVIDQEQLEESLAQKLAQMKLILQGTQGT